MKRFYSILLTLCVSCTLFAQLSIWNGSSDIWTKGAGTEASPFLIESAEQLAFISDMVNGGVTTYENTYFKLMTNIDLNNQVWVPIGNTGETMFKGHFDGWNHSIYGALTFLFGYISNASITRINIEMQGLAKYAESSVISYVYSYAIFPIVDKDFCIDKYFGCIVTECLDTDITFCIGKTNASAIRLCFFGGIVGKATNSHISNCRTYSNNIRCSSTLQSGDEQYTLYRGGIVGYLLGGEVRSCSSACSLNGFSTNQYPIAGAGDIIGGGYGDISYCESIGYAHYRCTDSRGNGMYNHYDFYCGVIGVPLMNTNTNIKNSFTILSDIYGEPTLNGFKKYGTATLINVFSSTDKTEASMKSASFPIILNTDSTVFIQDKYGVNDGYPIYKEQVYAVTIPATDVQLTSAILNANYYALNADSIGFEYKQTNDKNNWYNRIAIDSSSTETSFKLEGLETGTNYTYRFWVAQNGVIHFGEPQTFTTQECTTNTYPETATICNGEEFEFANRILTISGVYYDTLTAVNGCDSVIELTLTVSPVNEIQKYDTIFVGDSYDFFGQILTKTGTYTHYVPAGNYCNLVIMNLYVKQPSVLITATANDEKLGTVYGGGEYAYNTSVSLMAVANDGAEFVTWTNGVVENPYIFKAVENMAIQAIFRTIPSGVDDVQVDENTTTKILQNGQLFIIRDGKTYTVMGQELK